MNILTVHEQYSSLLALGEGASWDPGKDPDPAGGISSSGLSFFFG
jgi:hypothetical protein